MRFLRFFILVLIVGVFLASQAARFLVIDDPQKSDAMVVLAGETIVRPARGLELLRQGMAPHLFIDAETGRIFDSHLTDIAQKYINAQPDASALNPMGPMTAELAAQLSKSVNRPVIVLMKNRFSGEAAARDQSPKFSRNHARLASVPQTSARAPGGDQCPARTASA